MIILDGKMHLASYKYLTRHPCECSLVDRLLIHALFGSVDPSLVFKFRYMDRGSLQELLSRAEVSESRIHRIELVGRVLDRGRMSKLYSFQVLNPNLVYDFPVAETRVIFREYDLLDAITGFDLVFAYGKITSIYPTDGGTAIRSTMILDGFPVDALIKKVGSREFYR